MLFEWKRALNVEIKDADFMTRRFHTEDYLLKCERLMIFFDTTGRTLKLVPNKSLPDSENGLKDTFRSAQDRKIIIIKAPSLQI